MTRRSSPRLCSRHCAGDGEGRAKPVREGGVFFCAANRNCYVTHGTSHCATRQSASDKHAGHIRLNARIVERSRHLTQRADAMLRPTDDSLLATSNRDGELFARTDVVSQTLRRIRALTRQRYGTSVRRLKWSVCDRCARFVSRTPS